MTYPQVPQVLNFLLKNFATGEIITETEFAITRFALQADMNLSKYTEKLVRKILCCGDVYTEYALNEIFIEGSDLSIR